MKVKKLFLLGILLFAISGCAAKKINLGLPNNEVPIEKRQQIIDSLTTVSSQPQTFKGLALARNKIGKDFFKVRYVFAVADDGRLRIDSLPINSGVVMTVLKSDGHKAILLDNSPKIAYTAVADENLLKKVLGVPLKPRRLPYFLTARVPSSEFTALMPSVFETEAEIIIVNSSMTEVYRFERGSRLLKRITALNKSQTRIEWELEWEFQNDSTVPNVMKLRLPQSKYEGVFQWRIFEINPDLSEELFNTEIPKGWKIEPLS